jgi:hypothetical protein
VGLGNLDLFKDEIEIRTNIGDHFILPLGSH